MCRQSCQALGRHGWRSGGPAPTSRSMRSRYERSTATRSRPAGGPAPGAAMAPTRGYAGRRAPAARAAAAAGGARQVGCGEHQAPVRGAGGLECVCCTGERRSGRQAGRQAHAGKWAGAAAAIHAPRLVPRVCLCLNSPGVRAAKSPASTADRPTRRRALLGPRWLCTASGSAELVITPLGQCCGAVGSRAHGLSHDSALAADILQLPPAPVDHDHGTTAPGAAPARHQPPVPLAPAPGTHLGSLQPHGAAV